MKTTDKTGLMMMNNNNRTQNARRTQSRSVFPLNLYDKSLRVPNVSLSLTTYPQAGHGPLSVDKQIPIRENFQPSLYFWRKFLMPTVHRFAQPFFGGSRVRYGKPHNRANPTLENPAT